MGDRDVRASESILESIAQHVPADDPKLKNHLAALRESLERDAAQHRSDQEALREFEEAYEKLTAPANRVGVLVSAAEDSRALVAIGESEYVVNVDPKMDASSLRVGDRVLLNEAFAVVGSLPDDRCGPIVRVIEPVGTASVRVGSEAPGSDSRIVAVAERIEVQKLHAGDEVRLDSMGRVALEHLPKKELRDYFFEEVPEIPWGKIGGQTEAIQLIRDTIEHPLLFPEVYRRFDKKPVKGILLYGPPGCGKTLIGKATAYNLTREYSERVGHEVKEYFMYVSGPKILNMWLGETERIVREIFETAREKAKEGRLVFIFVDEAESVLRTRSGGRWLNISNTVVPQFCAELDGLVSLDNVVLLLTSNRPDYIDPAVLRPERIDRKVKVGRPSRDEALQIASIYLHESVPIDPELLAQHRGEIDCARRDLIEGLVRHLWRKAPETEFLQVFFRNGSSQVLHWGDLVSGALLKSIVDRAKDYAIKRVVAGEADAGIRLADLEAAARDEYAENEIFPKSDTQEDWLKLLDFEPENVVAVKPIDASGKAQTVRKTII
ncbi:MAG: AAA family ATPase [Armatimonadetes bacterium]|nr:AAA family ATPase [Armatimonadota bacterium]NOG39385.1 AAA family ATPase [Armatimonadota bacterium]GIK31009.1 MAG: proteasome-associated ATPase [Armatimonadota bacterium]